MSAANVFLIASLAALAACGDRSEQADARGQAAPVEQRAANIPPPATADAPLAAAPAGETVPQTAGGDAGPRSASRPSGDDVPDPAARPDVSSDQAPAAATPEPVPAGATTATGSGTVLRVDKLYSAPSATAPATASVAKGAKVEIFAKEGGWLRVKVGNDTGWMRLLSVRAGSGALGGAALGDVVGVATTRSDATRVVAVAGLRGLNDEDLKQAQFNSEELARLETRNPSATQVRSFASQAGLAAATVPNLPNPRARSSSTWESN